MFREYKLPSAAFEALRQTPGIYFPVKAGQIGDYCSIAEHRDGKPDYLTGRIMLGQITDVATQDGLRGVVSVRIFSDNCTPGE